MRKFEKSIDDRKQLVNRISELTGLDAQYTRVPRCAYVIGSFTVEKDGSLTVEDGADEAILEALTSEEMIGAEIAIGDQSAQQEEPARTAISFPLSKHTPTSVINLICMIHSRGTLVSKATGGTFYAAKELVSDLMDHPAFRTTLDVVDYLKTKTGSDQLRGISFDEEKVTLDGFGEAEDPEHLQTFMKLAAAMNKMAISQKRVQAKDVDDANEKYAFRIWLIRLGMNGGDCKEDRKRLMENLSGHTAFRTDEERERWAAKQAAKREALKAVKVAAQADETASTAV